MTEIGSSDAPSGSAGSGVPDELTPAPESAEQRLAVAVDAVHRRHRGASSGDKAGRYRSLCSSGAAALRMAGASLTLITPDGDSTLLAASDPVAEQVAELQFTTGDGPTVEAFTTGTPVLDGDLVRHRWPLLRAGMEPLGVRAVFVFPLQVGAIRLGVLCLHDDQPGPLSASQLAGATALARAAVDAVFSDLDEEPSVDGWLGSVDGHDHALHQATGMVLEQLGATAEVALLRLRAHAFRTGRPLGAVAADVVARRLSFRDGPGGSS